MTTKYSMYATDEGVNIIVRGRTHFINRDSVLFAKATALISEGKSDELVELLDNGVPTEDQLEKALAIIPGCEVFRDRAFIDGLEVPGKLLEKLVQTVTIGLPIQPLVALFRNLQLNPSRRVVQGFFKWIDMNHLAYTDDGCFLAYKIVDQDFMDLRTRTFDNSPGAAPSVPRNTVDDDFRNTCSAGLHGCGFNYLPHYGGFNAPNRVVSIKVNPADLVAFPEDYNHSKFRCCGYVVLEEIPQDRLEGFFDRYNRAPVQSDDRISEDEFDEEDEEDEELFDEEDEEDEEDEFGDDEMVVVDDVNDISEETSEAPNLTAAEQEYMKFDPTEGHDPDDGEADEEPPAFDYDSPIGYQG